MTARANSRCARFRGGQLLRMSRVPCMSEAAIETRKPQSYQPRERPGDPTETVFALPVSMPLVLDLDGTLIASDLLYKSFFSVLRRSPLIVVQCARWLLRGRAALKRQLALRNRIDWDRLEL